MKCRWFVPGMLLWLTIGFSDAATNQAAHQTQKEPKVVPPAVPRVLADSYVRAVLQRWVDKEQRSPGIAVGIIDAKGPRVIAYGRSGNPVRPEVDGDTLFEIGSITKTFTATLLADMVKGGEVGLETPLRECLPSRLRLAPGGAGDITLRQLATHTSGLLRLPADDPAFVWSMVREFRNPYAHYSREQLFAYLERSSVKPKLPHPVEYSNLGMGVLGEALAHKAGSDYETLLTRRVLKPLGMSNTWIRVPAARQALFAAGHNAALDAVSRWDLPSLAGAGAVRSSAADMLKFLAANMNVTPPIDSMLHQVMVPEEGISVGLGWLMWGDGPAKFIWHNGGTDGFTSFIGFYPAEKVGLVILNNSNQSADELGLHLLDPKSFKLEFPAGWGWLFLPLALVGLATWRVLQPADPSGTAVRRWFLPAPVPSRLQVLENIVEVAIGTVFVWKFCAWPPWGRGLRVALVALVLLVAVRLLRQARRLPWARPWGWAKWLYHLFNAVVCLLLLAFVVFSLI